MAEEDPGTLIKSYGNGFLRIVGQRSGLESVKERIVFILWLYSSLGLWHDFHQQVTCHSLFSCTSFPLLLHEYVTCLIVYALIAGEGSRWRGKGLWSLRRWFGDDWIDVHVPLLSQPSNKILLFLRHFVPASALFQRFSTMTCLASHIASFFLRALKAGREYLRIFLFKNFLSLRCVSISYAFLVPWISKQIEIAEWIRMLW